MTAEKNEEKLLRMRSIKWKLIIMYLGLVLIVMIVSGTYILLSLRNIEIDKSRQSWQPMRRESRTGD